MKLVGRRCVSKESGWPQSHKSEIGHVVSATPYGMSEGCQCDVTWRRCEYHNITLTSRCFRAVFYTSARTYILIDGILLIPGTGQMACLVTQRGNAFYSLIMCLRIAWEHICFTSCSLMQYRRFECRIIGMILIPTWKSWFEPNWWLKPSNCSAVHCMWLTFGDVSNTYSSHHVIVVAYTTCYCISLCEMNSKLDKGVCLAILANRLTIRILIN